MLLSPTDRHLHRFVLAIEKGRRPTGPMRISGSR